MVKQVKSERFPDLQDELLYPRMSETKMEWLAERGERRTFEPGDVLYQQGQRDTPFYVIDVGLVDLIDRKPGKDIYIAQADSRTFIGDIAAFTGEPTISACVAAEHTEVIAFERTALRAMLAQWPELAEHVLRTLLARRAWHEGEGHGLMRLIASRSSRRAAQVRDLLERNLLPVRWYDVDTDPDATRILDWLQIPPTETPVLMHADSVLRNPSAAQVARSLGLRAEVDGERFDVVVLGAGPAGLASAVYGGSEGLRTLVVESWAPGGQAGTSTRIENYLGFPTGISGTELTRKAMLQARRFDAVLSSFHRAVELADGPDGLVRVDLDDGQYVLGRTVVMATGARWRELDVEGVARLMGAGVYHTATTADVARFRDEDVIVVGGGNSAGQAAVQLASHARSVRVAVRGTQLASTMSQYLVSRIERSPRIEVMTQTKVDAVHGNGTVDAVSLCDLRDGTVRRIDTTAVFVMIGADPCTDAATGMLGVDEAGYLLCGAGAAKCSGGATCTGRSPTGIRCCSRPYVPAYSPRATCARVRQRGWPAPSEMAPWPSASLSTYFSPDSWGTAQGPLRRSFALVGTDGGLLPKPATMSRIRLSPGERAEVVVDMAAGEDVILRSHAPDLGAVTSRLGMLPQ